MIEYISQPLRVLMGKSYYKYKRVAEDMMFLNKAVRTLSKRELMAIIGYFALKYGIVEQPQPQYKGAKNGRNKENREKASNREENREKASNREENRKETPTASTSPESRMDDCRLE